MCFQNHEQLRDPDFDLFRNDADLTFMFGDTAITANGASGGGTDAAGASSWSVNGKRSGSTSEEALERDLESREHELLSRGTRLVFPTEDHVWAWLPLQWPETASSSAPHPAGRQASTVERHGSRQEPTSELVGFVLCFQLEEELYHWLHFTVNELYNHVQSTVMKTETYVPLCKREGTEYARILMWESVCIFEFVFCSFFVK